LETEENHKTYSLDSWYPSKCEAIMVLSYQPQLATARNFFINL
jgi:hypothetical protein